MTREETIYRSFRECPKTIGQVSRETGIDRKEVRRLVREMDRDGKIYRLSRSLSTSGFLSYRWTTNVNIAWGYRTVRALSGKSLTADEQLEVMRKIRTDYYGE